MKNQGGFSAVSVVLIILLVVAVIFSARFVGRAAQDNKKQSDKISNAVYENEVNDPSDDDYIPESPDDGSTELDIKSVNVQIQAIHVILEATLPSSYTGNCSAIVSLPDGSEKQHFTKELKAENLCTITIPREKLDSHKTWRFQMNYYTKDGLYNGSHPPEIFSLQ